MKRQRMVLLAAMLAAATQFPAGAQHRTPQYRIEPLTDLTGAPGLALALRKLTTVGTNWIVTTLGGMAGFYGTVDGSGNVARFGNPTGVAVDSNGYVYIADHLNERIVKTRAP